MYSKKLFDERPNLVFKFFFDFSLVSQIDKCFRVEMKSVWKKDDIPVRGKSVSLTWFFWLPIKIHRLRLVNNCNYICYIRGKPFSSSGLIKVS